MSNNEVALLNIKRTAFHEQLHNLGHLHGVDPEVSYTCQECCFPTADATAEATNAACVVCGGDYASITDPDYLRDITAFPDSHGITRGPLSPILANLRENPTDKLGMANLALLNAGIHGAVGVELGNILSARPDLTPEVREVVDRALTYNSSSTLDPYRPGGRIIAQALVIYYLDQDPLAALAHIRANENLIKDQFALGVSRNDGYVLRNMRQNLNTLLQEAMGRYQRGDTKDSYALSNEGNRLTRLLGL